MTNVTSAAALSAASTPSSTTAKQPTIDPNSFLKLLVAELQYQDPSRPMDTHQLVSQLSAMSQVEQAAQTNSKLSAVLDQLNVGQSGALLGRTVTSADGTQSGSINAVRVSDSGLTAVLASGTEIPLERGVMISA